MKVTWFGTWFPETDGTRRFARALLATMIFGFLVAAVSYAMGA